MTSLYITHSQKQLLLKKQVHNHLVNSGLQQPLLCCTLAFQSFSKPSTRYSGVSMSFIVLSVPEPGTVLLMWCHKCSTDKIHHFLQTADYILATG